MKRILTRFGLANAAVAMSEHTMSLLIVDAGGTIVKANTGAHEMFGYEHGAMEGMTIEALLPADIRAHHRDLRASMPNHARIVNAGRSPLRAQHRDGTELALFTILIPVAQGKDRHTLCVNYPREGQRTGDTVPQHVLQTIGHIMAANDEVFYVVGGGASSMNEGSVAYVNETARTFTGISPEAFREDPRLWFSLIHPDDVHSVVTQTADVFERAASRERRYRIRNTVDGRYRMIEDRVTPEFVIYGKPTAIFGIAREVNGG